MGDTAAGNGPSPQDRARRAPHGFAPALKDDAWYGWRAAAESALYGPGGFYHRPEGPAGHFRTSVHASPLFAAAVARLLCRVDEALGHPAELAFVDMGAGHGELVTGVLAALPPEVASRARGYAVERAAHAPHGTGNATSGGPGGPHGEPRHKDPADRVLWRTEPPQGVTGLLFANEWLDNVPVDVVETDPDGVPRQVLVRRDGTETLGDRLAEGPDALWLRRWWPLPARPGLRAEIGRPRDTAWTAVAGALSAGYAVAADYVHLRHARPPHGSLSGFRAGRETRPVPDGSCDVTAHVAVDACAAAGAARAAGAAPRGDPGGPRLVSQRAALRALGVNGARPPLALASRDPAGYVRALAAASEAAELTAPGGLGDFGWLLQPVRMAHPEGLDGSGAAL